MTEAEIFQIKFTLWKLIESEGLNFADPIIIAKMFAMLDKALKEL